MASANLQTIREDVRKLTLTPSFDQASDAEIDFWINTFCESDFPQLMKLFDLNTTFEFYTNAFVDTYETATTDVNDPLYNFKNRFTGFSATPTYVAGYPIYFTQSRTEFYALYPQINSIQQTQIAVGDGVTTHFEGIITGSPILAENVVFSSSTTLLQPLALTDVRSNTPTDITIGDLVIPNDVATTFGTVNYITGAYSFDFPQAPGPLIPINSQTIPYVPSRPLCVLFFDNKFTFRPVPDQPYRVTMEVFRRPSELLNDLQDPDIQEFWQFISHGASIKLMQRRADDEGVQRVMPEFLNQKRQVQRKTLFQNSNVRSSTIYVSQLEPGLPGWNGFGPYNGWY